MKRGVITRRLCAVAAVCALLLLCVLANLVAAASALGAVGVPVFELSRPFWDNACGVAASSELAPLDDLALEEQVSWHEQLGKSLQKVRNQLTIARDLLLYREFDNLYIEVKRGVLDRQYIPNWVPSKGDVEALLATETLTASELARHLPTLLKDLQKFAVAFEQVYKDEYNSYEYSPREKALEHLIGSLKQTLCEVESALWSLDLSFGPSISRDMMAAQERDIPDFTHRMVRDNGVLIKYRDYLTGWNRLIRIKQITRELKK